MFGLNEISWKAFLLFLLGLLLLYYSSLVVLFWLKRKTQNLFPHYENDLATEEGDHSFQPIKVSSGQFPSEIIPLAMGEDVPLEIVSSEDPGSDQGIPLKNFLGNIKGEIPEWMKNIEYQQ